MALILVLKNIHESSEGTQINYLKISDAPQLLLFLKIRITAQYKYLKDNNDRNKR